MAADPYKYFRIEGRELLDELARLTLDLESSGKADAIGPLLRAAHTLKGAARVVKQPDIAGYAHAIEEALAEARLSGAVPARDVIDTLFKHLDEITAALNRLPAAIEPAAATATSTTAPAAADSAPVVRADITEVDELVEGIVETSVRVAGLRNNLEAGLQVRSLIDRVNARLLTASNKDADADALATEEIHGLTRQLRDAFDNLQRSLNTDVDQLERELHQALEAAENIRLVPAGSLFVQLERAARDAAQALDKRVQFETRGGDVRLEGHVLGTVQSALLHIVRNAVAHGIEPAEARRASNKPVEGRIRIEVERRGKMIEFACSDDGRGIDFPAVQRVAKQRGDAIPLDQSVLMKTLLRGGLSTAADITTVSGRGIGLDVVRDVAQKLGGEVHARTEAGSGTTFVIAVPLSRAMISGLAIEAAGMTATIPLDAVLCTLRFKPEDVLHSAQGDSLLHEGRNIPLFSLDAVLGKPGDANVGKPRSAVVIRVEEDTAALCIDELIGVHAIVMRALPMLAPALPFIAGASLDVEGNPQLMLDPKQLLALARGAQAVLPSAAPTPGTILVIDDSLTTRMLERSILESAGYKVDTASSAEEGLDKARAQTYALFLVDVEMPGMDGYGFIERTRADPALRDIPCILVTSRASPEDLQRGREVGAYAHIDKGQFDQGNLLRHIRELLQ